MTYDFKGTLDFVKKYSPGYFSPDVIKDVIAALELAIKEQEYEASKRISQEEKISHGLKAWWERRRLESNPPKETL